MKRYEELRKSWLNFTIASTIARKLEQGHDFGGWVTM